jgi:hypothetical protein
MKTATPLPTFREELNYVCKATTERHGAAGLLYRNRWATGYQDLVMRDKAHAENFAKSRGATVRHT